MRRARSDTDQSAPLGVATEQTGSACGASACSVPAQARALAPSMSTVNEWLMERGFGDYIWAFATQGFEGRECLQELMSLDEAGLDRLAVQTLRNAERALGVVPAETREEANMLTSTTPGLYVEINATRLGRAKGKTFTEYGVDVCTVDRQRAAQTWHRFSEFDDLRKKIQKQSQGGSAALPKLPKKKAVSKADAVVQDRMLQLRIYVERLLVTCPSAARPQLDEFLGLVGVEMPAAPPPPAAAPAAVAVAVKLPPRLQALADKLDLERDEVDEILESVDHDVEQAIEFIREEYREQLGDAAEHSEESDEEDESETHMAGRDSIDDLSGGWGGDSEYDPRATTTQVQVLDTIDETDNEVTLHGDLNFMDDYFSAEAEPRRVQQPDTEESDADEPEAELEPLDVEAGLRGLGLLQYLPVVLEYGFDDPSVWVDFDEESWEEMFDTMEVAAEHRGALQSWFTEPADRTTDARDPSPTRSQSPRRPSSSPVRAAHLSPQRGDAAPDLARQESGSPGSPRHDSPAARAASHSILIPEWSPRRPLPTEADRGFGEGFFPGAALPKPRRASSHLALEGGGGASSGPLFSVVYTDSGVTHAWSEAGAVEMRAACSNPRLTGDRRCVTELDAAQDAWASRSLPQRSRRRGKSGTAYKLINDAHSHTIGPNMNVCISTLIESYQQEAEMLQVVHGIAASERLGSVRERDVVRRGGILSPPGATPRPANGWSSGPHCSVSNLPLSTSRGSDGSRFILAQRGGRCIRDAHVEVLSSRVKGDVEMGSEAASAPLGHAGDVEERFLRDLDDLRQAEAAEEGKDFPSLIAPIEQEIGKLKAEYTAASSEEKQRMADEIRGHTGIAEILDLRRQWQQSVLRRAKGRERLEQRTRQMCAEMEAAASRRARASQMAAVAQGAGGSEELESESGLTAGMDPVQQLHSWLRTVAEEQAEQEGDREEQEEQEDVADTEDSLDALKRIFADLEEGDYKNCKFDLRAGATATPAAELADTVGWACDGSTAVAEADFGALLEGS